MEEVPLPQCATLWMAALGCEDEVWIDPPAGALRSAGWFGHSRSPLWRTRMGLCSTTKVLGMGR